MNITAVCSASNHERCFDPDCACQCHQQDESIAIDCELCGTHTDKWERVPDCDRTVGYHGHVDICASCRETYSNHCGQCA